jgi:hypothetical protein
MAAAATQAGEPVWSNTYTTSATPYSQSPTWETVRLAAR